LREDITVKKEYKIIVRTHNEIAGFHHWENAPGSLEFLRYNHRHIFVIKCLFPVTHGDRDIEIFVQQNSIERFLTGKHPQSNYPVRGLQFGGISCEMIAAEIMDGFDQCLECEVLEDGKGGAIVRR
jgi:hypothetical protein